MRELPESAVCATCRGVGFVVTALGKILPAWVLDRLPRRVEFASCPACGGIPLAEDSGVA